MSDLDLRDPHVWVNALGCRDVTDTAFFGGTTAYSGGVLWVPGNFHAKNAGVEDSREAAKTSLRHETGNFFDEAAIDAFLDEGPRMLTNIVDCDPDDVRIGQRVTVTFVATEDGGALYRFRPIESVT